ncbi:MAG: acyl-CoA synthetase [Candidatus Dactylopiibacterium sp.]|nr:acyl-CoA synthetase [Candidatus Dactylopiibacterium sp.]
MTAAPRKTPQPAWLDRKERGSLFWLRVMQTLSLTLGRNTMLPIVWGIALYFLLTSGPVRRAQRIYLARALGRPPRWRDLYHHVRVFATTIHDRSFLLGGREQIFDVRYEGDAALRDAHAAHGGLLLFGAHLGSFEILKCLARQRPELRVVTAMYAGNSRQINQALEAINPEALADVIPLGRLDAMLTVHQRLEEGALVGILADRASGADQFLRFDFLGAPADFPTGPFRMAAMLRRPVFFMTGLYRGGLRYDIVFEPLADFSAVTPAQRDAEIRAAMQRYVLLLERHCRTAPWNWFNFFDFWESAHADAP